MKKMKKKREQQQREHQKRRAASSSSFSSLLGTPFSGIQSFSYSSSKDEEKNHPPTPDTMRDSSSVTVAVFFTRTARSTEKDQEAMHRYETTTNGLGFGASSSSNHQQKQVQKIVPELLSKEEDNEEGEGLAPDVDEHRSRRCKGEFFYGYAESDKWYEREQIGKEEFGTGKIADTKTSRD